MNFVLWFVSGLFASAISSLSQKWTADRMRPDATKTSRFYFISGFIFRLLISAAVMFLAIRAGFTTNGFVYNRYVSG